jgi:hypothetical protein
MERPTACQPDSDEIQSATCFHRRNRDRRALPSRRARRGARLRQIGGGQPSRRPIAGGPQLSRAWLDRSGSARHARQTASSSRQSHATLHRDLRPTELRVGLSSARSGVVGGTESSKRSTRLRRRFLNCGNSAAAHQLNDQIIHPTRAQGITITATAAMTAQRGPFETVRGTS